MVKTMNSKKHDLKFMPQKYFAGKENQKALNEGLRRVGNKYQWSERDGLEELSILHANLFCNAKLSVIFVPSWEVMTDFEGRTIRKQLHDPNTFLRSWDLLANECLVVQSEDKVYAAHVANWCEEHLKPQHDEEDF